MPYECCSRQQIFISDFRRAKSGPLIQNRHCQYCNTHWYAGMRFTAKEWDAFLISPPEVVNE